MNNEKGLSKNVPNSAVGDKIKLFSQKVQENNGPVKKSSSFQREKFYRPKNDYTGAMPGNSRRRQEKDDTLVNLEGEDSKLIDVAPLKNNQGLIKDCIMQLSWSPSPDSGVICENNSLIRFHRDKSVLVTTAQKIPNSLESFTWEATITKSSNNVGLGIGFITNHHIFEYWNHTGNIISTNMKTGTKNVIANVEEFEKHDSITLQLKRIDYFGFTTKREFAFNNITFLKNNKELLSFYVELNDVSPLIYLKPMIERMERVDVETNLEIPSVSDLKGDQAQLLSWQSVCKDGASVVIDGSKIEFCGTNIHKMITTLPVPDTLNNFSFMAKIIENQGNLRVDIGFILDLKSIIWRGDGYLDDVKAKHLITKLSPFGKDDTVAYYLHVIKVGDACYRYMKFFKNQKQVGGLVIDEKKLLKPMIQFAPLENSTATATLQVCFGNNPPPALDLKSANRPLGRSLSIFSKTSTENKGRKNLKHQTSRTSIRKSMKTNDDIEIIDIFKQDGSKLLIAKSDDNGQKIQFPFRTYFEIEIEREGNIALELKCESDSVIYDGLTGDILRGLSKEVFSGIKLQTGSSLEVSAWTCEEKRNMPHTLVEFYVDGKIACKRPISIIGSNINPVVYIDTERNGAKFVINTEEGSVFAKKKRFAAMKSKSAKLKDGLIWFLWTILLVMLLPIWLPLAFFHTISWYTTIHPISTTSLFVALLLNVYVPILDNGTDFYIGYRYMDSEGTNYNPWYAGITLFLPFFPFVVRLLVEVKNAIKWMIKSPYVYLSIWDALFLDQAKDCILILPFVSPFFNLFKILELTSLQAGDVDAERIILQIGTHSNWEPFLESLPQFLLQVYVSMKIYPDYQLIISIVLSLISLSLACSSTFLFERIKYPVASAIKPKLFLAFLFLGVVVPRVLNIALFLYVCLSQSLFPKNIGNMFICIFPITSLLIMKMVIHVASEKDLKPRPIWNQLRHITDEDEHNSDSKGEYEEQKENGYNAYQKELEYKAILLSLFAPCITVSEESKIFPITALVSTLLHFTLITFSWTVFTCDPGFHNMNQTLPTTNNTYDEQSVGILGMDGQILFPVAFVSLFLSFGILIWMTVFSSHISLRRVLKRFGIQFNHGGLIAMVLEELANEKYEMEIEAKIQGRNWKTQLKWQRSSNKQPPSDTHSLFSEIAEEKVNFSNTIITRRTKDQVIAQKPFDMIKSHRWAEDHIPCLLDNLRRNKVDLHREIHSSKRNTSLKMHHAIDSNTLKSLYRAIKSSNDLNVEDENHETALMKAVRKADSIQQTQLLLFMGSSISYSNVHGINAFDVSLDMGDKEGIQLLWEQLLNEQEHHDVFRKLCRNGNIEGVKWCLDNTSSGKKKEMIEWNKNKEQKFPLLFAIKDRRKEICSLLIKEHKLTNKTFLMTNDTTKSNILIYSAFYGDLDILKDVVEEFKENDRLDLKEVTGMNAFMIATYRANLDCVKFLFDYYSDANLLLEIDLVGNTALQIARYFPGTTHRDIVEFLKPKYPKGHIADRKFNPMSNYLNFERIDAM